jgi:hypothetical protein
MLERALTYTQVHRIFIAASKRRYIIMACLAG